MTMSANLHHLKVVKAYELPDCDNDVLKLRAADGSHVTVFMPMAVAQAMADAFNAVNVPKEREADAAIGGDLA